MGTHGVLHRISQTNYISMPQAKTWCNFSENQKFGIVPKTENAKAVQWLTYFQL